MNTIVQKMIESSGFANLPPDIQWECKHPLILQGRAGIWSLNWISLHYLKEQWEIYPSRTLIDNIGLDGSGRHHLNTAIFDHDSNDQGPEPFIFELNCLDVLTTDRASETALSRFLDTGPDFLAEEEIPQPAVTDNTHHV